MSQFKFLGCWSFSCFFGKVTIATLQLTTTLNHYTAPSVSGFAYLQAKTKNESEYPLLASDKMNVYVDGSLLTKTSLRSISPGEVELQIFTFSLPFPPSGPLNCESTDVQHVHWCGSKRQGRVPSSSNF